MRIWNRALSTLLNPGGLEPEPGEISGFKDARKPKSNKAKPEPGRGFQELVPERTARGRGGGALLCPPWPPGSGRPGARGGQPGARSGPASCVSFRFLLRDTKVARATAQQPRSAARGPRQAGGGARACAPRRRRAPRAEPRGGGEGGGSGAPAR